MTVSVIFPSDVGSGTPGGEFLGVAFQPVIKYAERLQNEQNGGGNLAVQFFRCNSQALLVRF